MLFHSMPLCIIWIRLYKSMRHLLYWKQVVWPYFGDMQRGLQKRMEWSYVRFRYKKNMHIIISWVNMNTYIFVYTILSKLISKKIPYNLDSFSNRQLYGDNKPIVIGIVLAVVIVLIGSVINFIYWRRKTGTSSNLN